ncbi:ABC transporter ATP-binding protein [Microbacterium mangrovi]|uniref:ABC transporter ATP-binding protein n=1 Tax=Microbacterium mangrovi TaxID=1348253 RepID=UPI0009E00D7A|nr:ABC transporter ATP-binding protein [Microbacterium mangrovi]
MIELNGIAKSYGDRTVLRDLTLRVPNGSVVWLSGESGSGKSTVLGLAALLIHPDRGTVLLDGQEYDIRRGRAEARSARGVRVGFMPQSPLLLGELTAVQNVMLAGIQNDRRAARRLLSEVGLKHMVDTRGNLLSGGQQHRVSLARALMNAPANLVVDEPTASLDDENARAVGRLLAAQAEAGRAVLVASHDARVGPFVTDRICLADGAFR